MKTSQEGIAHYLKACRHDIAHLSGTSAQDDAAWITNNQAAALALYNETLQVHLAEGSDGMAAAEAALVAVKQWAQGSHFRAPA